jgi:hypothetical protein
MTADPIVCKMVVVVAGPRMKPALPRPLYQRIHHQGVSAENFRRMILPCYTTSSIGKEDKVMETSTVAVAAATAGRDSSSS